MAKYVNIQLSPIGHVWRNQILFGLTVGSTTKRFVLNQIY